jgi:hypothetical protein
LSASRLSGPTFAVRRGEAWLFCVRVDVANTHMFVGVANTHMFVGVANTHMFVGVANTHTNAYQRVRNRQACNVRLQRFRLALQRFSTRTAARTAAKWSTFPPSTTNQHICSETTWIFEKGEESGQ